MQPRLGSRGTTRRRWVAPGIHASHDISPSLYVNRLLPERRFVGGACSRDSGAGAQSIADGIVSYREMDCRRGLQPRLENGGTTVADGIASYQSGGL